MLSQDFWPCQDLFRTVSCKELSDGRARFTGVALLDEGGTSRDIFFMGENAHFFFEFEILDNLGIPSGGIEIFDTMSRMIHGKESFLFDREEIRPVEAGNRLRFHQVIRLDIRPGYYSFNAGLAVTDEENFLCYRDKKIPFSRFNLKINHPCLVTQAGTFEVRMNSEGQLLHHGLANLPGSSEMTVLAGQPPTLKITPAAPEDEIPTVFHVTHWKAGSQWIAKILWECAPGRVIPAVLQNAQFRSQPIQRGKIYSTVYVTREEFESVRRPANSKHFVIIRDLRDTLVSAYFSFRNSHPVLGPKMARWRHELQRLDQEQGLIFLMKEWLDECAEIQLSWVESGESVLDYNALLENDVEILEKALLQQCQLPLPREKFREIVAANRFEELSQGRTRGIEDVSDHIRKGIAGDWKNYFTERIKTLFKARFGGVLVASGHEKDLKW